MAARLGGRTRLAGIHGPAAIRARAFTDGHGGRIDGLIGDDVDAFFGLHVRHAATLLLRTATRGDEETRTEERSRRRAPSKWLLHGVDLVQKKGPLKGSGNDPVTRVS